MKIKDWLQRFLYGRNGSDELARSYSVAAVAGLVASLIVGAFRLQITAFILECIALIFIILSFLRIFSRNLEKRRRENAAFLALRGRLFGGLSSLKTRLSQRRNYRFFKCPKCRAVLRVPRGKGRIVIKCRCCGEEFSGRS